jgi:hypothetical protein
MNLRIAVDVGEVQLLDSDLEALELETISNETKKMCGTMNCHTCGKSNCGKCVTKKVWQGLLNSTVVQECGTTQCKVCRACPGNGNNASLACPRNKTANVTDAELKARDTQTQIEGHQKEIIKLIKMMKEANHQADLQGGALASDTYDAFSDSLRKLGDLIGSTTTTWGWITNNDFVSKLTKPMGIEWGRDPQTTIAELSV